MNIKKYNGNEAIIVNCKLNYLILTIPDPVRCSESVSKPSFLNIKILISNNNEDNINLQKTLFYFSIGENPGDLTNDFDNIETFCDKPNDWDFRKNDLQQYFIFEPASKDKSTIKKNDSITVNINKIRVSQSFGTVLFSIKETTDVKTINEECNIIKNPYEFIITDFHAEPSIIDLGESTLLKWKAPDGIITLKWPNHSENVSLRADFTLDNITNTTTFCLYAQKKIDEQIYKESKQTTVTVNESKIKFFANPDTLYDLHKETKLFWNTDKPNKKFFFKLHSDGWQPEKNYTWDDGEKGVLTPSMMDNTVFALDVKMIDLYGQEIICITKYAKVKVAAPYFSSSIKLESICSGKLAIMNWVAFNASKCCIIIDEELYADNIETDTYGKGFPVALRGDTGEKHQIVITAYAKEGSAAATVTFPIISIKPPSAPIHLPFYFAFVAIGITSNGKTAVVVGNNKVQGIDIENFKFTNACELPHLTYSVSINHEGTQAYFPLNTSEDECISIVKIPEIQIIQHVKGINSKIFDISITPDDKYLWCTVSDKAQVAVIDLDTKKVVDNITVGSTPIGIDISPDGKLAIVANRDSNSISIIDVEDHKVINTINVPAKPKNVAITPDSKVALISCNENVTFIDIAKMKMESALAVSLIDEDLPRNIKISSDGTLACVINMENSIAVIDVLRQKLVTNLPAGKCPTDVVFLEDKKTIMVTNLGEDGTAYGYITIL